MVHTLAVVVPVGTQQKAGAARRRVARSATNLMSQPTCDTPAEDTDSVWPSAMWRWDMTTAVYKKQHTCTDRAHASTHRNRPSACWTGPGTCNNMSVSFQFCVEPVGSRACWTQSNHTTSHLLHLPLSISPMMMINTVLACRVCRREEPPVIRCPSLQMNWQMQKLCQRM